MKVKTPIKAIRATGEGCRQDEVMKRLIIKEIENMQGAFSPYQIFSDWVCCCSIAVQNAVQLHHNDVWQKREQLYLDTLRRYPEGTEERFAKMFCLLGDQLTEQMSDALGEIYMEAGMGSKYTGQFFTPFHLSELVARLAIQDSIKSFEDGMTEVITLHEPSCGGGGMIIAAAKVLKNMGINYQRYLDVVAQDLDWKGVYMTHLQCSLLGIKAIVVQGDTLAEPFDRRATPADRIMWTPAKAGVLI